MKIINKKILLSFITIPFLLNASDNFDIKYNIFGTIGGSYNTNENFIYRNDFLPNTGSQNDFSFATDTKLGTQLELSITPEVSVIIQGDISQKEKGKLNPTLEWANIKYEPNENFNVRIGKMRTPMFMYSDVLNVSYAYPWVRTPNEVYSPIPFTSYNGIETEIKTIMNDWEYSLQLMYGSNDTDMYMQQNEITNFILDNYKGATITALKDDWKFRFSYAEAKVGMESPSSIMLSNMLSMSGFSDLANKYISGKNDFQFLVGGFNYDNENYFAIGEYATYTSNGIVDKYQGYYLSSGYHFEQFTPYFVYGKSKQKNRQIQNEIPNTFPFDMLHNYVEGMVHNYNMSQETKSIGVRYDFKNSMALKFQYDKIDIGSDLTSGYFQVPLNTEKELDVFSLTFDFAF